MKLQLRSRFAVAFLQQIQDVGVLRIFCSRKYFRFIWLCALIVFIITITSHLHGEELFLREVNGKNFVGRKFENTRSLKNSMPTTDKAYQNISIMKRHIELMLNERLSINKTMKTTQNTLKGEKRCHSWCRKPNTAGSQYFLTAVLLVRIYSSDLAKLSTRELLQWLYYLKYAGFEHVYVYDAYVYKNESQKNVLEFLVKEGFVTYVDWSRNAYPYSVAGTQESAYQHCLDMWGNQSKWQASIDIDEYPFCPQDTKPNFMQRFIADFSRERPDVSQITMQNFLFLGKPLNDTQHPFLIDRLKRRTRGPSNSLVKPIYKTSHVKLAHVHHHDLLHGISVDAGENRIRLNHYWGARLQNWGEDTPEILSKTIEDNTMEESVEELLRCDRVCLPDESMIYMVRWN